MGTVDSQSSREFPGRNPSLICTCAFCAFVATTTYARERWLTQHDGYLEYRPRVWLETRDRSRSRCRYLNHCEPSQEYFPFSARGRAVGGWTHCVATPGRCHRVEFARRDPGKSQQLV